MAGVSGLPGSSTVAPIGHVDDLAAAYALGALEPDEAAAVDAHIRGCPACERIVAEAQRTTGMLPFIVPLHSPPADTKATLFARVGHAQRAAAAAALPMPSAAVWRTPTLPSAAGADLVYPSQSPSSVAAAAPSAGRSSRMSVLVSAFSVPLLIALIVTG